MDWRVFFTTFAVVFLAELGDKTQLATMVLAADRGSMWTVFAGASIALVISSLIAVLLGSVFSRYVPTEYLRLGAGILFVALGLIMILDR